MKTKLRNNKSAWPCFGAGVLVSAALCFASPIAGAADNSADVSKAARVDKLNEQGVSHYARREYRQAIDLFSKALAIDPDPNLLFNIARCHERLGDTQAAIDNYELFVNTPGADAQGRVRAQEALAALRRSQQAAVDKPPAAQPPPAVSPPPVAAPNSAPAEQSAWPQVALWGGVVTAAAGAAAYYLGTSDHRKVTRSNGYGEEQGVVDMTRSEAQSLVDSGDLKKLAGGVGLGLGSVLLATYAIVLRGDSNSSEPADVAVSVVPSLAGTSVSFTGSF